MTTQFRTIQETKAHNDFGQQYSDQIYNATLTAATNTQLTVPGGGVMGAISSFGGSINNNKVYAVIRTTGDVWVAVNQTADVPNGSSFAKDTSELVTNVLDKCYLVSVSVAFYALPS